MKLPRLPKLIFALGLACGAFQMIGVDAAEKPSLEPYAIAIEPAVLKSKVAQPLGDSRATVMSPATETATGLKILAPDDWKALGLSWPDYQKKAITAAAKLLSSIEPVIEKDSRDIVQFIKLHHTSHLTSSLILAPELYTKFSPMLGRELLVVVPDRFTLYLFPRRSGAFLKQGPTLATLFVDATYPASSEAFELTETSLKSIGTFITEP
jgi:hypothetical protein